jgi:amino acid adenylation domain-containing protein
MADVQTLMSSLSAEKRALLEKRLMEKRAAAAKQQLIPRRTDQGPCPLSFAQELMWLLDHLIDTSAYHVPRALRMKGPLNVEALEFALNKIVERHEVLRTTYQEVDGHPMQFVTPSAKVRLKVIDLSGMEPVEREKEAQRILVEEGKRNFDFVHDLLLRTILMRLDKDEHILLLVSHHIASDGISKAVLFRELKTFYLAHCEGTTVELPPLPIQYSDYALWQRDWMQGDVLNSHIDFWKNTLGGAPTLLELPTDNPRPASQSFEGARQFLRCPDGMLENFKALCRKEGSTLFMTMLAAFGTLLWRWSGQEDMLIGTPVSGRSRTELEPLIGYFSNSVVLRMNMSGDPTFRELLKQTKEVALAAYSHQHLPFEKLVTEMQPQRDLSYSPMYQVMFSVGEHKDLGIDLPGMEITPIIIDRGVAKFDMTLGMTELKKDLMCNIEYCSALFEPSTMQRLANQFQNLLQGIVENPDQRISRLPMLSAEERHKIIYTWNEVEQVEPDGLLVPQMFEKQAALNPDATAVVYEDRRLTYRELNERANQLAHYLKKRGVGPEKRVVVCVERSPEMVLGVMGVMKAGGAYVPLDAMYAKERLPVIIPDSECPVVLTQTSLLARLPETNAEIITLDGDWPKIAAESKENPECELTPDTLAYVVYTSGSTGVPKGVMINHGGFAVLYHGYEHSYGIGSANDAWLLMANFSFDVFSSDLIRTLCSGSKFVICPMELLLNPEGLYGLMRRENVSCAEFVPAVLRTLTTHLQETKQNLDFMRILVCSSDAWSIADARATLGVCDPKLRVINAYGVTEATIDSTYMDITPEVLRGSGFVAIGKPIPNNTTYVLDRHMQPCPVGIPGVLYIGGPGVARGYLKRPELTAEKFVADPFSKAPGATLYNSGDAARYLPDGNVEFLGRVDNQVKIRGFRIELGEVEAAIAKHPAVQQVVVIARELGPGDLGLVAYVVAKPGEAMDIHDVRASIKGKLPAYMLPAAFEVLEKIPLSANRKVDRKALPAPKQKSVDVAEAFVAPRNEKEEKLAALWSEVLHFSPIGVNDNFFELGGHSLMAIQVISRVRTHFGVELPLRILFENPTVAELCVAIEAQGRNGQPKDSPIVAVRRESVRAKRVSS